MTLSAKIEDLRAVTTTDLKTIIKMAIGRVLRMGSRPTQTGDVEQYDRCRWIAITAAEIIKSR